MRDLQLLIDSPQESMEVEYKNWLSGLSGNQEKAVLAKEIIALSNHGGGYIVIGFDDDDSILTECAPAPGEFEAFAVDSVISVIHRYVTPSIQVEVALAKQTGSTIEHPIIIVPGAKRMPLWATRASPDSGATLKQHTIYIRRPGAQSAPPQSQDDWERLLERLVLSRISLITDAVRAVVDPSTSLNSAEESGLEDWAAASYSQWKELLADLSEYDDRRLASGHWTVSFQITEFSAESLRVLLEYLTKELQAAPYWRPFNTQGNGKRRPQAGDNEIVAWLGADDYDGEAADWDRSNYWRLSAEGYGFSLAPMEEDADYYCSNRIPKPEGSFLDLELPAYRILSVLKTIKLLGDRFGTATSDYALLVTYHHMNGRVIECHSPRRFGSRRNASSVETIESKVGGTVESLSTNLVEAAYNALRPIYEKFDFFDFPRSIVSDAIREIDGQ